MNSDLIASLLGKLSERTGREWTLADIVKLAEKMPKGETGNVDSLMDELSEMGLDMSDETRERIKNRMNDGKPLTLDELEDTKPKNVKGKSKQIGKPAKAGGKSKHLSMVQKIKNLSTGGKQKKR